MNTTDIEKALKRAKEMIDRSNAMPDFAILQKGAIRKLYKNKTPPKHIEELLNDDSISENTAIMFAQ